MEDKLILLVEDNPHIMAINDAALHMRGYRTLQAETAHKCRELLCFHAVDLIVLDILLPDDRYGRKRGYRQGTDRRRRRLSDKAV